MPCDNGLVKSKSNWAPKAGTADGYSGCQGRNQAISPFHRESKGGTEDDRVDVIVPKAGSNGVVGHFAPTERLEAAQRGVLVCQLARSVLCNPR
jgi:hypothetical protein